MSDYLGTQANDKEEKQLKEDNDDQVKGSGAVGEALQLKEHRVEQVTLNANNVGQTDRKAVVLG